MVSICQNMTHVSPPAPGVQTIPLTAAREQFVLKLARVAAGGRESCGHHVNKYRPCLHNSIPSSSRASGTPGPLCPRRLMFRVSRVMPGMMVNQNYQKILFIVRSIDD